MQVEDIHGTRPSSTLEHQTWSRDDRNVDTENGSDGKRLAGVMPESVESEPPSSLARCVSERQDLPQGAAASQHTRYTQDDLRNNAQPVPGRRPKACLASMNEVVLSMLLSFLDAESLDACGSVCQSVKAVALSGTYPVACIACFEASALSEEAFKCRLTNLVCAQQRPDSNTPQAIVPASRLEIGILRLLS